MTDDGKDEAMRMSEADLGVLIPSLPDDVARQCLLRVLPRSHFQLQQVSPRWRELVSSPQFYQERKCKRKGTSAKLVAMMQALEAPMIVTGKLPEAVKALPVFGISDLNVRRTWERLPSILDFPDNLPIFCRLVTVDGKLIVFGGWNLSTYKTLQSVYMFNFVTQTWSRGASMPTARSFFACAAMDQTHIFIARGHNNFKTALKSAEVYNIDTDQWTSLPPRHEERDESTGLCRDGAFYVVSGYSSNSQGQFTDSGEVYNLSTNSWTLVPSLWRESSRPPSPFAIMLGRVYMVQEQNLLCFNEVTGVWTVVETIPDGEVNFVCLGAVDKGLLVAGPSRNKEELGFGTFLYKPRSKGGWDSFERKAGFLGMA